MAEQYRNHDIPPISGPLRYQIFVLRTEIRANYNLAAFARKRSLQALQRGDMFNIIGIPDKYKDNGLFQINSITHTIENMTWQTQIEGLYRQNQ